MSTLDKMEPNKQPWSGVNRLQSSQKRLADTSNFEKSNLESMDLFNFEYE